MIRWFERGMNTVHDDKNVRGFFGEYRWLSNYHECSVMYENALYRSSEAAYQAAKTLDLEERKQFEKMGAGTSKKVGQTIKIRENWDNLKNGTMYDILMDKFTRNLDLKQELLKTGDRFLEETNWWGDKYWGTCNGEGKNQLGITLMGIRAVLQLQEKDKTTSNGK